VAEELLRDRWKAGLRNCAAIASRKLLSNCSQTVANRKENGRNREMLLEIGVAATLTRKKTSDIGRRWWKAPLHYGWVWVGEEEPTPPVGPQVV
jgi:hypothetical protein